MLGPNARATTYGARYHHRSADYRSLLSAATDLMHRRFKIPHTYSILFLTGSGTLANESVAFSLKRPLTVRTEGEFSSRIEALLTSHGKYDNTAHKSFDVLYETAESKLCELSSATVAVDCVSSFPYYDWPDVPVWTTVTSKQLGALPIMSIVVVRSSAWSQELRNNSEIYSYLNLVRYRDYFEMASESPHTPSIALLDDFVLELDAFNVHAHRARIDERRAWLTAAAGEENVVGGGPVFTFRDELLSANEAKMAGVYRSTSKKAWQAFLWSGTDADHAHLARVLRRNRGML